MLTPCPCGCGKSYPVRPREGPVASAVITTTLAHLITEKAEQDAYIKRLEAVLALVDPLESRDPELVRAVHKKLYPENYL